MPHAPCKVHRPCLLVVPALQSGPARPTSCPPHRISPFHPRNAAPDKSPCGERAGGVRTCPVPSVAASARSCPKRCYRSTATGRGGPPNSRSSAARGLAPRDQAPGSDPLRFVRYAECARRARARARERHRERVFSAFFFSRAAPGSWQAARCGCVQHDMSRTRYRRTHTNDTHHIKNVHRHNGRQ